jgi:hypothetical protein
MLQSPDKHRDAGFAYLDVENSTALDEVFPERLGHPSANHGAGQIVVHTVPECTILGRICGFAHLFSARLHQKVTVSPFPGVVPLAGSRGRGWDGRFSSSTKRYPC